MIDRALDREFVMQLAGLLAVEEDSPSIRRLDQPDINLAELFRDAIESEGRRGIAASEAEAGHFMPRNLAFSVLQTAIEEALREDRPSSLEETPAFDGEGGPLATRSLAGDFTKSDWRWIRNTVTAIVKRILVRGTHPFNDPDDPPEHGLASDARLILVSDWGTGAEAACKVGSQIEAKIIEAGSR